MIDKTAALWGIYAFVKKEKKNRFKGALLEHKTENYIVKPQLKKYT